MADPATLLKRAVLKAGSQSAAAKALGIRPQHLCDLLASPPRRPFGPKLLQKLGLRKRVERSVTYTRIAS